MYIYNIYIYIIHDIIPEKTKKKSMDSYGSSIPHAPTLVTRYFHHRGGADSPEATVLVRFIAIHRLVMAIIMVSNGE